MVLLIEQSSLGIFSPDAKLACQYTEHENLSPQIGFATIIEGKVETEERLAFLLDRLLSEKHQTEKRTMLVSGSSSSLVRDLRTEFVQLAIADGHALKDIASFLHVSHETVRRIGKGR